MYLEYEYCVSVNCEAYDQIKAGMGVKFGGDGFDRTQKIINNFSTSWLNYLFFFFKMRSLNMGIGRARASRWEDYFTD